MENGITMSPNELVRFLKKSPADFTRDDIIRFIEARNISMINFRYPAEDGKLKVLNFVPYSREHLVSILSTGERVDGSSLFSFVEPGASDLYIIPRFRTAFVNPFSKVPALDILCSYYNNKGLPLENSPEYVLRKAYSRFRERTGLTFRAFGELEFYIKSASNTLYPLTGQNGYHQSLPFSKFEELRVRALDLCARAGCRIKYGHCEVGSFSADGFDYEQHEIEFLPVEIDEAVEQLMIAKWILRVLGYEYGVEISFAAKITIGTAGSGMHVHMMLERNGRNIMVEDGRLSNTARKMIAGILDLAAPLTAFGNTIPTSYLRLVPDQEAPTNICWGDRNRSVLVRVPLGWLGVTNMIRDANPLEDFDITSFPAKQSIELRSPDGSADIYLLFAGLVVAAQHGLEMPGADILAEDLYVDYNIFREKKGKNSKLKPLPSSCYESADALMEKRLIFEKEGIFPASLIEYTYNRLKSFNDKELRKDLNSNEAVMRLVDKYLHCG
ncbi:MAG: glutamine synthetase [Bacteroidales bacterium]|nr:glutamine synthetase [Bacteroidales bacterium]